MNSKYYLRRIETTEMKRTASLFFALIFGFSLLFVSCNKDENPRLASEIIIEDEPFVITKANIFRGPDISDTTFTMGLVLHDGEYNQVNDEIRGATIKISYVINASDSSFLPEGDYNFNGNFGPNEIGAIELQIIRNPGTLEEEIKEYTIAGATLEVQERDDTEYIMDMMMIALDENDPTNAFTFEGHYHGHARVFKP